MEHWIVRVLERWTYLHEKIIVLSTSTISVNHKNQQTCTEFIEVSAFYLRVWSFRALDIFI